MRYRHVSPQSLRNPYSALMLHLGIFDHQVLPDLYLYTVPTLGGYEMLLFI